MSAVTTHERPGVYSAYEISSVVSGAARNGVAAIAAASDGGEIDTLYTLTSIGEAEAAFGKEDKLTTLVKLLLLNGAARVLAVPVDVDEGYENAFFMLANEDDVKVMICDSEDISVQQELQACVEEASAAQRERIAVVSAGMMEPATQVAQRGGRLNSERVVLVGPAALSAKNAGAMVAAAVAGAICAESDPAVPLGGAVLRGLPGLITRYSEDEVDVLIQNGVTPLESVGGRISVIRGVTTRISTGGVKDATWRELTTILVVDHVIPRLRESLRARFSRSKNTQQVRGAIRSQVILELEKMMAAEIITGYGEVTTQALADNPTVCLVEFSFTVAHGLNQIWLSAQITV